MDGSQGNNNSAAPAPFLTKTYEMVDDPSTNAIVSWSHSGYSFVVWNPPEFAQELLPKYFKHNNFSSFVRQLNTYGFRKIDPDQWEFANAEFIRGQRHLLKHIHRRKPIHSHSLQNQMHLSPLSESEKKQFKDEIMRLKNDKCLLQQELQRHEMDKQQYQFQILNIGQRVETMEYKQIQMMTCLAQLMQKPQFSSILMKLAEEYYSKKKRLLKFDNFNGDCKMEGNHNLPLTAGNLQEEAYIAPVLDEELVDKLDSSLNCWENFIYRVEDSLSQQEGHGHGYGIISQPSSVTVRELSPFSDDGEPSSPGSLPSPPCSKDVPSSPEVAGCFNHVDTPMTPCCPENNMSSQCSVFEANVEPASLPAPPAVNECSNDSALEANNPSAPAGENDCFWENFLSEAPVFI